MILVLLMPRTHLPSTVPENVQEIIKYINDYTLYSTLCDHCFLYACYIWTTNEI